MLKLLKKFFGTAQSRLLAQYQKRIAEVNKWEETFQALSEEELPNKTQELKDRFQKGESLDELLPEAFGLVKNACRRLVGRDVHVSGYEQKWDMVPYDVQILGAIAMHHGSIAEMQTGEGKTLTASMPLYLNALSSKPVHLVTVNDYLAKRDCEWIGSIFKLLGLTVASLTNDVEPHARKEIYAADIVYGTSSEFGFDYLRDNSLALHKEERVQRGHYFALVDEIDSILIDEARTPLIISGPSSVSRQMYETLKDGVSHLVRVQRDFCNQVASQSRKVLEELNLLSGDFSQKHDKEKAKEAFKNLWLVSKGTPRNKILKRIRENPDLRAKIEDWETYFYSDQNKEEKQKVISQLYILVDERASEYELTDKGIEAWNDHHNTEVDDFVLLDLGHEYAEIDATNAEEKEKMERKLQVREEDAKRKERIHNLRQLFRAHLLMEKDVDYIVQENKIVIIDENTGRPQPGRRFSDGLHQAIEAKEGVKIQGETQTFATITLQNYFRMYDKLAGMTGTAMTEANEFKEIYQLEVLEIPTYKACVRKDYDDEIYMTEREKYTAILKEIQKVHDEGRPILIGTESVEISEKLSRILKQNRLSHTMLNAKNHEREAEIIAEAGNKGAITLATNMAGRGTDIKLKEEVSQLGGLHVIGTSRHHSRRIDRQLRGRSGRLGDPGSSKFFVSFEDSLMRLFASPRITALLQRFRPPEGEPISAKVLNKSIETAQKRVEQRNYTMRKHTLEFDDVMNKQRSEIYAFRTNILTSEKPAEIAKDLLQNFLESILEEHFATDPESKQAAVLLTSLRELFPVSLDDKSYESLTQEGIKEKAVQEITGAFSRKLLLQKELVLELRPELGSEEKAEKILHEVLRNLLLRKIDFLWQEHLLAIDHLRSDVFLRSVGQKDPLIEFKEEAFFLFESLSKAIQKEIATDIFLFEMVQRKPVPLKEVEKKLTLHKEEVEEETSSEKKEPIQVDPKVGRNDFCPCGSKKKYKKCCGQEAFSKSED